MKYEIFSPDNISMGYFYTLSNHPGEAQRIFSIAFSEFIDNASKTQPAFFHFFPQKTNAKIKETLNQLINFRRADLFHFYFKPAETQSCQ